MKMGLGSYKGHLIIANCHAFNVFVTAKWTGLLQIGLGTYKSLSQNESFN